MTTIISTSIYNLAQVVPIPNHGVTALPAPAWLLETLLLATFWVHQLFVSAVLGAVLVLFVRSCCHLATSRAISVIDRSMIRSLPPVLSLAIATGIAPLLFVQTLYGQYSYSSNIFMGYFWLGSLVLLLVGFVCLYLSGWLWNWKISVPALAILPICFLGIVYIYTNNSVLAIQPEHWLEFHRHQSLIHVKDPITIPRLLNNISWSLVIGGLYLVWTAHKSQSSQQQTAESEPISATGTIRWGLLWHIMGLVVLVATRGWYCRAMPSELNRVLAGQGQGDTIYRNIGIALMVVIAVDLLLSGIALLRPKQKVLSVVTTMLSCLLIGGIVFIREKIRRWYVAREVAGSFSIDNWQVQSQSSAISVFAICFVIALVIIAFMLVMFFRSKPSKVVSGY